MEKGEVHYQDDKDGFTIFVSRDEDIQYLCFHDRIPSKLMHWIMEDPIDGNYRRKYTPSLYTDAVRRVILTPNKYVSTVLTRCGIMRVETAEKSPDDKLNIIHIPRTRIVPQFVEEDDKSTDSEDSSTWESATSDQDTRLTRSTSA